MGQSTHTECQHDYIYFIYNVRRFLVRHRRTEAVQECRCACGCVCVCVAGYCYRWLAGWVAAAAAVAAVTADASLRNERAHIAGRCRSPDGFALCSNIRANKRAHTYRGAREPKRMAYWLAKNFLRFSDGMAEAEFAFIHIRTHTHAHTLASVKLPLACCGWQESDAGVYCMCVRARLVSARERAHFVDSNAVRSACILISIP